MLRLSEMSAKNLTKDLFHPKFLGPVKEKGRHEITQI